ncbi:NAD(P)/FAD-dependent oxidoreductase [Prauserella rugosa]|uniref:NADH dehydrogenase FAD-containing subunit n=1 Tax=Prauserella rugosa TaxID=43354 RepID=A0A660CLT3_9PSEU|nr:FAD-dependent oxidoreductase [Prauserella rugosa]KID30848.1 NADH dehydrogenase, FAD-containing subunit [Prauserella sp. Am3]TWH22619.1 NADH dehydrogenase FAD-containing subunit [Prauserella rugosa]
MSHHETSHHGTPLRGTRHRIVVLGAGYAGSYAAGYLARRLHRDDVEITVVNAAPDFVERMRLHQFAAGHDLDRRPLADVFAGTGIDLRIAEVTGIDADNRTVTIDGQDQLGYDSLVYTLGSTAAHHAVPGAAEHAFHVATAPAAGRLRARLGEIDGGRVVVVGGNLTAIEAATEIAESRPGLTVALATTGELGGWLGARARRHVLAAFDRLGIDVHEHATVTGVDASSVTAMGGTVLASDATVWAAGFAVHPIAAAGGLDVTPEGQIVVDRQLRSVSHPDVYAAGDSAHVVGDNGLTLPMSCATAGLSSRQLAATVLGDRTGRRIPATPKFYVGSHVSLGRRDAVFQLVDKQAQSRPVSLRGRAAARFKASVLTGAAWSTTHPTSGLPSRRHRLAASSSPAESAPAPATTSA